MPIGGFVVTVMPDALQPALEQLHTVPGIEIHGSDKAGNVVVVLESETSEGMEELVRSILAIEQVLNVGLTYFNAEDEVDEAWDG